MRLQFVKSAAEGFLLVTVVLVITVAFAGSTEFLSNTKSLVDTESSVFAKPGSDRVTALSAGPEFKSVRAELATEKEREPGFQDFGTRCQGAGVLVCEGFDAAAEFAAAKWPAGGLYPAWDGVLRGTMDTVIKASGTGSLRFEIPSHSAANTSGYWTQPFERNFGQGSTFYVQFRQRFSKEMLTNKWGDTTWKQAIFHNRASTCADVELTTVQYYHTGLPIMYTDCGARSIVTNNGDPPYKLQQGDYNCWYSQYNAKDCFLYPADQWVTFYYEVSIGHWGKPDSNIQAWTALDGKPYRQWIKMNNFILKNEHPGKDYDTLTLLTYMTNKNAGLDLPKAYTWYDELIISTRPIAVPTPTISGNSP